MPITFPNSPSTGDTHTTSNGLQYTYDGEKWTTIGTNSAGTWTRTGTTVSLTTATDDLNVDSGTLFVDASTNNVGIGTAAPSTKLHVNGTTPIMRVSNGTSQIVEIKADSSASILRTTTNHPLLFGTNDTERLRILSDGKLGVGTSSPGQLLHLNSSASTAIQISDGTNNQFISSIKTAGNFANGSTAGDLLIRGQSGFAVSPNNGSSVALRVDSSGNVGIGGTTVTDSNLLNIQGTSASSNIGLVLNDTNTSKIYGIQNGGSALKFFDYTASAERLRITSDGNIGIGQSNPSGRLEVTGGYVTFRNGASSYPDGISAPIIYGSTGGGSNSFDQTGNLVLQTRSDAGSYSICMVTGDTPTERLRIDSSGNVGINELTPDSKVDIVYTAGGDATTQKLIHLRTDGTAGYVSRGLFVKIGRDGQYDNSAVRYDIVGSAGNSGVHIFENNSSETMRIDSSGNLGLGTAAPQSKLNIGNAASTDDGLSITFTGDNSTLAKFFANTATGQITIGGVASNYFPTFHSNGSERMRIDSSGNVGIGTSSPSTKLHIADAAAPEFRIVDTTNSCTGFMRPVDSSVRFGTGSNHPLEFHVNSTERMRIDSSGNLGLGTSSPSNMLHINGSSPAIRLSDTGANGSAFSMIEDNNGLLKFRNDAGNSGTGSGIAFDVDGSEKLRLDSSGRLLVGTTANIPVNGQSCSLQVEGTDTATSSISVINRGNNASGGGIQIAKSRGTAPALVQNNDKVGGIFFAAGDGTDFVSQAAKIECFIDGAPSGSDTPGRLTFSTTPDQTDAALERMRIDSSGNVGISTTSADRTLHVRKDNAAAVKFGGENGGDYAIEIGQLGSSSSPGFNATGGSSMLFKMGGTEAARLNSSGNLGVGLTSPASKLHVKGGSLTVEHGSPSTGTGQLNINSESNSQVTFSYDDQGHISFGTASAPATQTGFSEKLRIDSSGRLLVNNTAATQSHPLQVTASANTAEAIVINARASDSIGELSFFANDRSTRQGEIQYRADHVNFRHRSGDIRFATGGTTERMRIDSSGHFRPSTNNTYDLGTSSYRWRNVYTNDLNLSNEGSANDVDGTWGNFTIQEGEDDLFLINRRSGKKYKFNLTEVN